MKNVKKKLLISLFLNKNRYNLQFPQLFKILIKIHQMNSFLYEVLFLKIQLK